MKVPWRLRKDVSEATLDVIAAAVDVAESRTSGEVHVHIVHNLLPREKPREMAVRTFHRLGIDETARRNGVLLFIVMKKRRFEIVADEGVHGKVGSDVWEAIAKEISDGIDHDGFAEGVAYGVRRIGDVLAEHFPREPDDVNELPDRPTLG